MTRSDPNLRAEGRWLRVLSTLNEFQSRLFVADKALDLGRGGITRLADLTGMSRTTITKAVGELLRGKKVVTPGEGRARQSGGGRKKVEAVDPKVRVDLKRILEETTVGDPMNVLRWTSKSTRAIAEELLRLGHQISWVTVARLVEELGYSLQLNQKSKEGPQHPDRDQQFRYIQRQVKKFVRNGNPVISVDTKKKELVGEFKNGGRTWRPTGQPRKVNAHDFPSQSNGQAIPYGAYDIAQNRAVVNVGISHDTAEFAVESIRRWWRLDGNKIYPGARHLLICADAGGSNGTRPRAWKVNLQQLTDELGMQVTVCHYPPGTSKWNKIEHRLFSFISINWKGQPLVNYEAVVNLIGRTRTANGLRVKAVLDTNQYETGVKISSDEMDEIQMQGHKFHPTWNYTFSPRLRH